MSEFKLKENLSDNAFITKFSDLEGRLDPLFYVAVENIQKNIINKARYECDSLIKSCSIKRGRFGHRPRNDPRFYDGAYPFIQTGDIVKAAESNLSIEYTQTLNELGLSTSRLFQPPKLLFTIAANIGDTAILDYPSCFPDSIVAIIPKSADKISIKYLNIYLRIIKPYIVELAPYSAQKNLNNQQLAQVPIITPPREIQDEIVQKTDEAYFNKQTKLTQAKALRDSIDDYLLSELGINLPEQDNSLENRIFQTSFNQVSGGRFDPDYSAVAYQKLLSAIENCKFLLSSLEACTSAIHSGKTPASSDYTDQIKSFPVVKVGSYTGDEINLSKVGHASSQQPYQIRKDDIFILSAAHQAEYVGRHIKMLMETPKVKTSFVGELIRISCNPNRCNSQYLFSILNLNIFKTLINREKTGQTSHIYSKNIKTIKIPLPPIAKQNEIASKITQMRSQAKQLQKEAEAEMEAAKQEVERMILGE